MADTEKPTPIGDVRDEVLREHRELMELITSLQEKASRYSDDPERWSEELSEILMPLRTTLHRHFTAEEEGPFANEFPEAFPHLAEKLEDLLGQHRELMDRIDHLLREVNESSERAGKAEVQRIRKDVHAFIEAIRVHEASENSLLQDAYLEDLGGSG